MGCGRCWELASHALTLTLTEAFRYSALGALLGSWPMWGHRGGYPAPGLRSLGAGMEQSQENVNQKMNAHKSTHHFGGGKGETCAICAYIFKDWLWKDAEGVGDMRCHCFRGGELGRSHWQTDRCAPCCGFWILKHENISAYPLPHAGGGAAQPGAPSPAL